MVDKGHGDDDLRRQVRVRLSECRLPELLGQVIEVIAHEHAESATRTRALRRVEVVFDVEEGQKGPQATAVCPLPVAQA